MAGFITIYIDNVKVLVNSKLNKTLIQVLNNLNKKIPHFCYDKNLVISGNCRVCMVEVKGVPKPVVACATPVLENNWVYTNSPLALRARSEIMEFLLLNHPLDCAVCDQGGECDLQDFTQFGNAFSRQRTRRRVLVNFVIDQNIRPMMSRCILCTKCVRLAFVIGSDIMGTATRGVRTKLISYNYKKNIFKNRLMGNIIDICPVSW